MSLRALFATFVLAFSPPVLAGPGVAETAPVVRLTEGTVATAGVSDLIEAMQIAPLLAVMRDEGLRSGEDIGNEMFPGRGGAAWSDQVSAIYDTDGMQAEIASILSDRLTPEQIADLVAFYRTDLGRRVVTLELDARRAMLSPSVVEASREMLVGRQADSAPRLALIEDLVAVLDLVENNVTGALNANFAFYAALNDAGAFDAPRAQADMLEEVWSEEPQIREESDAWVYSYLFMAYEPLSDTDIAEYIAFSASDAGQALNSALFAAFDTVFTDVSRQLGLAAARYMGGEDL
ncbi:DUF2059 domain-containing protein [Tropicimonas sp. IMCC34043]|uniref:DUF2059 domain-containing protein n=1 Tax=Tropicimonas sp. IMCC34043 TaxID=2248760 RepID=UPI000E26310C|nr:DUF2059 domain-containing protein [Tropicimonas sp. IMCC34043]